MSDEPWQFFCYTAHFWSLNEIFSMKMLVTSNYISNLSNEKRQTSLDIGLSFFIQSYYYHINSLIMY